MSLRTKSGGVLVCVAAAIPAALWAQAVPAANGAAAPAIQSGSPAATTVAVMAAQAAQGGTIRGTVVAGTAGKPGGVPLPGVAVTATNTLTGRKYAAATDINGAYSMSIPRNGRYVVRAELVGFAPVTQEVVLNGGEAAAGATLLKTQDFGMELASRAAAAEAREAAAASASLAAGVGGGLQNLSLNVGDAETTDASTSAGGGDVALPSLGGSGDLGEAAAEGNESIAVNGQVGQTNGLANFSEDEVRQRVEDAVARARANGQLPPGGDPTNAIVNVLGGMMGGGGFGGGRRGGGGGGGGGRGVFVGGFRNFNPAQPHGNVFYQGSNAALDSSSWLMTAPGLPHFTANPSAYSNRFGVSLVGSPYISGLFKPNAKQFGFLNITGQKNLNAFAPSAVRVPTLLERAGDFSQSEQVTGQSSSGGPTPVMLYDPTTGLPIPGNNLANATVPMSAQALALLNYYPAPNISTTDPTAPNFRTISNAGSNNIAVNSRFIRTIGQAVGGPFGRGGFGRGGGRNSNAPPSLRQNINVGFNYSHSASDLRNIFLPLGGATESNGYGLNVGYTIGYGRLSNNSSLNWNRLGAETRNYFTDTANDPTMTAGIDVPNQTGGFADPRFYNGLPTVTITNFASLTNESPNEAIHQTISFSDFVSWRHAKHNLRLGLDVRRVHADSIGGDKPLGAFSFTGYATESPADKTSGSSAVGSGSGFADFLLGLPQSTSLQAGLDKIYLRENVYDGYAQDDFRVLPNATLNYGVRYEYFAPYTEKNNRLVNLDHDADFSEVDPVEPGGRGTYGGAYPRSMVNPDRTMFAPRFGAAWRPKSNSTWWKDTVVRGGYGINYNTGQYATFARELSFQPPFAATQTNDIPITTTQNPNPTPTGCVTTTPTSTANMTLANGFGCATEVAIQNNYSVNKNYRLGMVQVFNLNVQRTLPMGIVMNLGYNGAKGSGLDVVGSPNSSASGSTIAGVAPFLYETSAAGSHSNHLVVSVQKRQQKGIALGIVYTYGHSIDNASSIGGTSATTVQNFRRLDLEEGNSSFDVRHSATGNWVLELPFGPNRAFFNKGGVWSHVLDGFDLSGNFTFATGSYFTPAYSGNQAEASSGNLFTQRPDRVFSEPIKGSGTLETFFNKAAFTAPAGEYGTASRNSVEGPGTVSVSAALSRVVELGETRSFEARVTAENVFNTVQYSGINTNLSLANYGWVTSAAAMRTLQVMARYRF
ncbi:MAG TPA: TonB-dependent receptor [Acidobacteriaceae bacterium]|nr:TonB-dependent receptor [Acidobacteriaceae bacterium]